MNEIEYLIISSTIDFSTDLICYELKCQKKKYLRINRDVFHEYGILYSLDKEEMEISISNKKYLINNQNLKSVYFRAPVFLRAHKHYTLNEQLSRSQWSAFLRNLIVFDNAKWINHPVYTYQAENKLYQLKLAKQNGLLLPITYVGNEIPKDINDTPNYIVKALDTALFYDNSQELFTYSSILTGKELVESNIKDAPIILQECLNEKVDIRVTYIDGEVFPVSITKNGKGIVGDWRKTKKEELVYKATDLPIKIVKNINKLMKTLKLNFGGIDFALVDNKYYFIEVNPTGEWAWLENVSGCAISKKIVNSLVGGGKQWKKSKKY